MTRPNAFLQAAYQDLDFQNGELLDAVSQPSGDFLESDNEAQWLDKGEWLSLATSVGAEKVLFVDNNPVIVFAQELSGNEENLRQLVNRIWCMARPRLLFVARTGDLTVYNLGKRPARHIDSLESMRLPGVARSVAEVQTALGDYRREQVETGRLFEDERFGGTQNRADEALIRNLKFVRRKLISGSQKLATKYAHALIGRSIFIRYLEDREVLIPEYFEEIAAKEGRADWLDLLRSVSPRPDVDAEMEKRLYLKVLSDKEFTYALFEKLSEDFNGDMFPSDADEKKDVQQQHLDLLQSLLRGEEGEQESLFFFAYKFDIIPIELISSIYEEFYHTRVGESASSDVGSHYTPSALVEFLLSKVLTPQRLKQTPRILDAAAGSGIFLVEAYRRIVRHRVQQQQGQRLTREQLLEILRDQIAGIEINPEAARIAAFSLSLALLHYQEPRAIRRDKSLPHLIYNSDPDKKKDENQFDILLACDSFNIEECVIDKAVQAKFSNGCAHVVVGNPPWGSPGTKPEDAEDRAIAQVAIDWCNRYGKHVGDRERSQAFIHRTLDLLSEGGVAGLLVSTGVFFKRQSNSHKFRQEWLRCATLLHVVNFAHVRELFFSGAIAPFASVVFCKEEPARGHKIEYWSAKETAMVQQSPSVVLSRSDLKVISQADLRRDDRLWKIYWWGNHRDAALISMLRLESPLKSVTVNGELLVSDIGRGFQKVGGEYESNDPKRNLRQYLEFPPSAMRCYGELDKSRLRAVPKRVHRFGIMRLYEGTRLLISQGINQRGNDKGRIIARLENIPFCFRNSIYGLRIKSGLEQEAVIILGIYWSSLARYFFFMTSGAWGMWHHKILIGDVENLPIRLPETQAIRNRITNIVQQLRGAESYGGLFSNYTEAQYKDLERQLDEAIFDLYELDQSERDLIRDGCEIGIDLFYNNTESRAVKPVDPAYPCFEQGEFEALPSNRESSRGLEAYLYAFLDSWRGVIAPDVQLLWRVIRPERNVSMLAVRFWSYKPDGNDPFEGHDSEWPDVLRSLDQSSYHAYGSRSIYVDGMARIIENSGVTIVKRNELRLWTASQAREDAEAALLQVMQIKEPRV